MTNERTDILCLCTPHGVGGAQNNAGRLTKAFRERGYNAQLGFLFEREPDYYHQIEDFFVVYDKAPSGPRDWSAFLNRCRVEIAGRRPRVTLGFHPLANIIGALNTGWTGRFYSRQAWPRDQQSSGTEKLETLLTRTPLVSGNIACSYFVKNSFTHRGRAYEKKTSVIYNEPPKLPEVDEDKAACQAHFGMTQGAPVLGTLGRLHEQKNFQLAIRAMPYVADAHLYMAGGGPQEEMLHRLASENGVEDRVHFLGPLRGADVTRFLKAVDLLLMTSIYEGHPLVMLEAMSAGAPVLAHDVEVMREAGGDAAVYASSDPADWGRKIHSFDPERLAKKSEEGRARAEGFASSSMVENYLSALGLPLQREK